MLVVIIAFVLSFTVIYIVLPLAIVLSIISFVQYLRLKKYKLLRNIAIALYIPVLIVALIYFLLGII